MRGGLLGLCLLFGCIEDQLVPCGDVLCPRGAVCRTLSDPDEAYCASAEQLTACATAVEGDACNPTATTAGWCHDGVCLPIVCGNQRVDLGEACDDGNTVTGDGTCAADCSSDETCGNGSVDPIRVVGGVKSLNEQCDDGNLASGDGCSSSCQFETPRWRPLGLPIPALTTPVAVFDPLRARAVLFGGFDTEDVVNEETFEWDGIGWQHIPTTVHPSARTNHVMAYDAARRRVVLYGGHHQRDQSPFGDTWTWDGTNWNLESPSLSPPPRTAAGMTYDAARKRVVMFGGLGSTLFDETWEWDGATWEKRDLPDRPSGRFSPTMAYDARRGRVVMIGGTDIFGDAPRLTWEYDGTTWRISAAADPGETIDALAFDGTEIVGYARSGRAYGYDGARWTERPVAAGPSRTGATVFADPIKQRVVLFGGFVSLAMSAETWLLTAAGWVLAPAAPTPKARMGAAAAYDHRRGVSWMFGGQLTEDMFSNEMWSYDGGARWQLASDAGPEPRMAATLAYDRARDRVVLFGGFASNDELSPPETWLWDGSTWTNAQPVHTPPARAFATMIYDPHRERVVLVGGAVPNGDTMQMVLDDMWEWDGSDWTEVSLTSRPQPRLGASGTFDEARSTLLVMHGMQYGQTAIDFTLFGDLWSWDGTDWTSSPTPAAVRFGGTLLYDPVRRVSLAYGGGDASRSYDDLWEWDGTRWHRHSVEPPTARMMHVAVPARGGAGFVVFGGLQTTGPTADPWRLGFENGEPRELCTIATIDHDGDGRAGCDDQDCWQRCTPACPPGAPCDLAQPHCGDGVCDADLEDCRLCPTDCTGCASACGDALCDPDESAATCPGDCA